MKILRSTPLLLLIALAALVVVPTGAQARLFDCSGYYGNHAGTAADPMPVSNAAQLETVGSCATRGFVFVQTQDIDLSGIDWTPIGMLPPPAVAPINGPLGSFNGTYDGGGHRITGLALPEVPNNAWGLFGSVQNAEIRHLTIAGASLAGSQLGIGDVGVLAGYAGDSVVTDVHVLDASIALSGGNLYVGALIGDAQVTSITGSSASGSVQASAALGGLVGGACGSYIASSSSSVTVRSDGGNYTGGLVGLAIASCPAPDVGSIGCIAPCLALPTVGIFDSQATGGVVGANETGGLVGLGFEIPIERSFAAGDVVGTYGVGGLVGMGQALAIADTYARGAVSGQEMVAGLMGGLGDSSVVRSYSAGRVTGTTDAGGLVGGIGLREMPVPVTSFWDVTTSGQAISFVGTGKPTVEMKSLATFSAAGWAIAQGWLVDSTKTWGICAGANDGYPYLLREYTVATEPCSVVPGAPTSPKVRAGDGSLVVSWGATASDGGAPVTSYTATARMQAKAAKSCTATAPALTCTIAGLTNGRAYTVSVVAVNRKGSGAAAVSGKVTPHSSVAVVSTRRSGLAAVSRVRVSGKGGITQVGTVVGSKLVACRMTASAKAAGVVTLRCALNSAAVRALSAQSLRVRLVTTFRSPNGTVHSAMRTVRFMRITQAPIVTG